MLAISTKLRTMMRWMTAALAVLIVGGCGNDPVIDAASCVNQLTEQERNEGWYLLFDGQSLASWRSYREEDVNSAWISENGCLTRVGMGGDIITRQQFADFELKLEWQISDSGNSGIFIRGDESGRSIHHTAFEMQVLDNAGHYDAGNPSHRSGALYDMIVPDHDTTRPVGSWNEVHIIAQGSHVEFWLNGRKTADFDQGSPAWEAMYKKSKFSDRPNYGSLLKGHIGLQDHWDKVWYRNIRIVEH